MKRNSFTLLELVLVIFIIGILSFLVLPNFHKKYQVMKFENYAFKFLGILKQAQNESLKRGRVVKVKVEDDRISFYLKGEGEESLFFEHKVPPEYQLVSEIDEIEFYPQGDLSLISGSKCLGKAEVVLSSKYGKKKIVLWAGSGNISIEDEK